MSRYKFSWVLLILLLTGFVVLLPSLSILATADTIDLYPAADTFIIHNQPDTKFGSSTGLMVGTLSNTGVLHARIRFSGIPAGATIQSATLRLYRTMGSGSHTLAVQSASRSWQESTLTWNTNGSTNRYTTPKSTYVMSNQTGYVSVDVTSHVQEWANGSRSNYGFHLSTDGTIGENHTFASRESATSSYRPKLEVTYSPLPPDPDLRSVSVIPSSVTVGEPFTVTVTAENDGGASPEGAINASVVYSDGTDNVVVDGPDASWADGTYNRAPGYYPIYNNNCQAMTAQDHMLEVVDSDWQNGESHSMSFTVTPQKEGTLYVRVRTTMRNGPVGDCDYRNDTSASGGSSGTDQQGWTCRVYTVTVNAPDSAEIVEFNPPTGTLQRGNQAQATVRVKNTGGSTRSFWVGLSFAEPGADEWPEGWYDIPPIETAVLSSGSEQTLQFDFEILWWLIPGNYVAVTAVWDGFDSTNNLMEHPRYDDSTRNSFHLESFEEADVLENRVFSPESINSLKEPAEFVHELGIRTWLWQKDAKGCMVTIDKLTPDGQNTQTLKVTVKEAVAGKISRFYGKNGSQLMLILPPNAELSNINIQIDGMNAKQWQYFLPFKIASTITLPADVASLSLTALVKGWIQDKLVTIAFETATHFLQTPVSYQVEPATEFVVLTIDFEAEVAGKDYVTFDSFDLTFDISFTSGRIEPIIVIPDLRYRLNKLAYPAVVLDPKGMLIASTHQEQEYRGWVTIHSEALGIPMDTYYRDVDADGYGDRNKSSEAVSPPDGYVTNSADCDDGNSLINPGATEQCNGADDDCDEQIDEGFNKDGDGYTACEGDCNDNDKTVYPGANEVCDGKDNDCDTQVDEGVKNTYYRDADEDNYGDENNTTQTCSQPSGYVTNSADCDDDNASINPGATELCNRVDDDCDGQVDEGLFENTYYLDDDGDGYGDPNNSTQDCSQPTSYVYDNTDCDDGNALINPGATELCNGINDDCDDQIDEGWPQNAFYRDADGDGFGDPNDTIQACSAPSGYVSDNNDYCPNDPVKIDPGLCGCGVADTDCEDDGTPDCDDTDDDNDNLPDDWELQFACLDTCDAGAKKGRNHDADGDFWSNYDEYRYDTNPCDNTSFPAPPEVKEVIPHDGAGIGDDETPIPENTSFAVLLEDSSGINITDDDSIKFTVDDGETIYEINLDDTQSVWVRILKLNADDPDTAVTQLWVVYHRAEDDARGNAYGYDTEISIGVDAKDTKGLAMIQEAYSFKTAPDDPPPGPIVESLDPDDPAVDDSDYDAGFEVVDDTDPLYGAKVVYSSSEVVHPTLGPTGDIPEFDVEGVDAVGVPMNLQPPTVFTTPVKIFIPCPAQTDVNNLAVYIFSGTDWVAAFTADGSILPGGDGCIVPNSRVNNDPGADEPNIAFEMYHFTGVQAGISSGDDGDGDGYTEDQGDCDDNDSSIHPGATELCNDKDDNCNGEIDDGIRCLMVLYFRDNDGDEYGDPNNSIEASSPPDGYVLDSTDCNDSDSGVNPGSSEKCDNGNDDDCDGEVDEGCKCDDWWNPKCCFIDTASNCAGW